MLSYTSRLAVFVSLSSDDDPKPSGDPQQVLCRTLRKAFCIKRMLSCDNDGEGFPVYPGGLVAQLVRARA